MTDLTEGLTNVAESMITNIKLNSENYHRWSNVVHVFLCAKKRLKYVVEESVSPKDAGYEWKAQDSLTMTWLWNSMEESVASNLMYMSSAKGIWDAAKEMYGQEKNVSRIYELFKRMFSIKRGDLSDSEYYGKLKGLWDELQVYQSLSTDLDTLKRQRDEFKTALFLSGLGPEFASIRGQLLASEILSSPAIVLARVQRASRDHGTSASTETSALLSTGRDVSRVPGRWNRGGRFDRGGRSDRGGGRGGRSLGRGRGDLKCTYCDICGF